MNHEWRVARRWFGAAAVVIAIIAAIPFTGPEGMHGGFAIQFLAGFVMVVCLVAGGVYAGRARVLNRLLTGDGVLADWRCESGVYPAYPDTDLAEDREAGLGMLGIVAFFCVLFGSVIWWADPDAGPFVALVLCGVIAVCWLAFTWNTTWRSRRLRGRSLTRAVVSMEGVYVEPWVYEWHTPGNRLDGVALTMAGNDVALVFRITTKIPGSAPSTHAVRVPVPLGGLEDAQRVVETLATREDK